MKTALRHVYDRFSTYLEHISFCLVQDKSKAVQLKRIA